MATAVFKELRNFCKPRFRGCETARRSLPYSLKIIHPITAIQKTRLAGGALNFLFIQQLKSNRSDFHP